MEVHGRTRGESAPGRGLECMLAVGSEP